MATHRSRGIGGERGKVKSSQSIIGMLHNGGVVCQALASTLPEASVVPTVKLIYTDILITIMNHQRHTLALNTLFIQTSALLTHSMCVTLALISLLHSQSSIGLQLWDYRFWFRVIYLDLNIDEYYENIVQQFFCEISCVFQTAFPKCFQGQAGARHGFDKRVLTYCWQGLYLALCIVPQHWDPLCSLISLSHSSTYGH